MLDFKTRQILLLGKIVQGLSRVFKQGGTAAPGLVVQQFDPQILNKLADQLKFSIVVSGTNGKTTTTRLIAAFLKQAGQPFYHNRRGSNLLRGIVSTLIDQARGGEGLEKRIGLWEVDEAVFPLAVDQLQPKIVILLNLFRDQLDRYGELDTLVKKWQQALSRLPAEATVILNADDPAVASLGRKLSNQIIYFGLNDQSVATGKLAHASDATMCPYCLMPLTYQACFISHQGIYKCPECGQIQPKKDIFCTQVKPLGKKNTQVKINCSGKAFKLNLELPGLYNVYNLLAAVSLAKQLEIDQGAISKGLAEFKPAFGRLERVDVHGQPLTLMLAKNPAGFNQILKTLISLNQKEPVNCLLALNDLIADGRDVSWIWDVDFQLLKKLNLKQVLVSGLRAWDLALRLKYASLELKKSQIRVNEDLEGSIKTLINQSKTGNALETNLYLVSTYTAMLEARKVLTKLGLAHSTWQD